jgi:hypothetical protein
MRRAISTARIGGPALVAALVCITTLLWPDWARSDTPFYEVTVPLGGPTEEDRARAFAEALQAVAVKASGRRSAATNRTVVGANPARYVQRYAKTADQMLKVGFAGTAVEELLQQAGLPLWPTERPVTVVTVTGADRRRDRTRGGLARPADHLGSGRGRRERDAERSSWRLGVRLEVFACGPDGRGTGLGPGRRRPRRRHAGRVLRASLDSLDVQPEH